MQGKTGSSFFEFICLQLQLFQIYDNWPVSYPHYNWPRSCEGRAYITYAGKAPFFCFCQL